MLPRWANPRSRAFTLALGCMAGLLVVFIVRYPEQAFRASLGGLTLWWKLVFPALMPFVMLTELLVGLGLVHAAGALLDRPLRALFRLSGSGGYALAIGLLGGYPSGAAAVAKLRESGLLGRSEAERLVAVTHLCNPVTMVTVIGVGMLHSPQAGVLIATVHYAAALAAALLLPLIVRSRGPRSEEEADQRGAGQASTALRGTRTAQPGRQASGGVMRRAGEALHEARQRDGRTFGKLLGDAVIDSIQTLLLVGGFIMLFSVFLQVLRLAVPAIAAGDWADAAVSGLLEPHIGAAALSSAGGGRLWAAALIGAALGWSGLAQHAQVLGLTRGTGIRFAPFAAARLLHGALAFALTFAFWRPLGQWLGWSAPGFAAGAAEAFAGAPLRFPLAAYGASLRPLAPALLALAGCAIAWVLLRRLLRAER